MKYLFLNWKQNTSLSDVSAFFKTLDFETISKLKGKVEVAVFPPFPYFSAVFESLKGECFLGSQDVSPYERGSYTGEVGASMLRDFGCKYSLLGHSERRQYFGEGQAEVRAKLLQLENAGVKPVLCVGESLAERENTKYIAVLKAQILPESSSSIIAYEPIWAIGTGKVPTREQISEVAEFISKTYGNEVLYGGSVNEKNIAEIFVLPHISGVLVGSAGLKADVVNSMLAAICEGI